MADFNLRNAVLKIKDGTTPTVKTLTVKIGEGNLSVSEKKNREYRMDRGTLDTVRDGDDTPLEVSFDFRWQYLKASTGDTPSVRDVLRKEGEASAWVTTDSDACAPYAVDLEFTWTPECTADDIETITLPDFRYEEISYDAKAGTIAVSGKCNVTAMTIARTAQV